MYQVFCISVVVDSLCCASVLFSTYQKLETQILVTNFRNNHHNEAQAMTQIWNNMLRYADYCCCALLHCVRGVIRKF